MDVENLNTTCRSSQIQQFPSIKLKHDDVHTNCSICIGDLKQDEVVLILPCVHKFHSHCIKLWLFEHNTCPTCRRNVIHASNEESLSDTDEGDITDQSDFIEDSGANQNLILHSVNISYRISSGSGYESPSTIFDTSDDSISLGGSIHDSLSSLNSYHSPGSSLDIISDFETSDESGNSSTIQQSHSSLSINYELSSNSLVEISYDSSSVELSDDELSDEASVCYTSGNDDSISDYSE